MKIAGIIAEYNPFHSGHAYQIQYVKETLGADAVVIAMSGNFVQRGAPALLEKYIRTKMALEGGADLVLELPVPYSTASAEAFAAGGVSLLNSLGVIDVLCFGCESGTTPDFMAAAKILSEEPVEYKIILKNCLSKGRSFPDARAGALQAYLEQKAPDNQEISGSPAFNLSRQFLLSPNNILGVEYCKALFRLSSDIKPKAVRRKGSAYHDSDLLPKTLPSASGIRKAIQASFAEGKPFSSPQELSSFKEWMPQGAFRILQDALLRQEVVMERHLDILLFYALKQAVFSDRLSSYQDMTPALANRIRHTIGCYQGFSQYTELLKTREITRTHIQRALLHVFLGLTAPLPSAPSYARILGFRRKSSRILKEIADHAQIPLISKAADAEKLLSQNAFRQFQKDITCSGFYDTLLYTAQAENGSVSPFPHEYQKQIVIL